jgi:hypothetical protein
MTTKAKVPSEFASPPVGDLPPVGPWPTPPGTPEERLQRIEAMGQRISGYVQFMCKVEHLNGSSGEAKEKAVAAFYERMLILERQLGRIQEELRLG